MPLTVTNLSQQIKPGVSASEAPDLSLSQSGPTVLWTHLPQMSPQRSSLKPRRQWLHSLGSVYSCYTPTLSEDWLGCQEHEYTVGLIGPGLKP